MSVPVYMMFATFLVFVAFVLWIVTKDEMKGK